MNTNIYCLLALIIIPSFILLFIQISPLGRPIRRAQGQRFKDLYYLDEPARLSKSAIREALNDPEVRAMFFDAMQEEAKRRKKTT